MTVNAVENPKASAWALFLAVHAALLEEIERRLADAGLPSLAWYDVLWSLERVGDRRLRMSDLADTTVISRSNLTRLVDRLESAGLVARERAEEDRRGAFAVLTTQGRAMRKRMWPIYSAAITELFEQHLGERDAAQMTQLLRRILAAAPGRSTGA